MTPKKKSPKIVDEQKIRAYGLLRSAAEQNLRYGLRMAADHCAREARSLAQVAIDKYDCDIRACDEAAPEDKP